MGAGQDVDPGCPPLGFVKWITSLSTNRLTSSMPGIVFTPNLLSVAWSRLSSVVETLCTAFFFLRNGPVICNMHFAALAFAAGSPLTN